MGWGEGCVCESEWVTINVLLHSVIKCHSRTRLAGVVYVCGLWKVKGRNGCVCVCVWGGGDQNELAMQKQEVQYIQKNNVGYVGYVVWCYVVCVIFYVWCSAVSCSVEYFHPIIQPSCEPTKCMGGQAGRGALDWIGLDTHHGMGWEGKMDYFRAKEKEKRKKKRARNKRERKRRRARGGGRSRHPLSTRD